MDATRMGTFKKSDLKPKKWHGYSVVLFILGSLVPPLAVAARFGIGKDFFVNVVCTICGYIPGHMHNFYIQNIRNNKNAKRTPKWAVQYGLVDDSALKRRAKRREWATRFNERAPQSALEGQEYEEGQIPDATPANTPGQETPAERRLWNQNDEAGFYGQPGASGSLETTSSSNHRGGRWHYPANFDDAEPESPSTPKASKSRLGKKKEKKDRWARTEDAYSAGATPKRKKSKSRTGRSNGNADALNTSNDPDTGNNYSYGPNDPVLAPSSRTGQQPAGDGLDHEF